MSRDSVLARLRVEQEVSVLIVGGGINGIGTFRELALNGVDVLLVDRGDFCSGASASSSHMAHGGLRYLENGEFGLVREALRERDRLLRNAPHLVKPLPTTIPIFKRFSGLLNAPLKFLRLLDRPAERGAIVVWIGLQLYGALGGTPRILPRHRFRTRRASLQRWPALNPRAIATATYHDGAILSPERLAIEALLDAEAAHPQSRAVNYVRLVRAREGRVELRDELSGTAVTVLPRVVINAAGPWIDECNQSLGAPTRFIGGTKGSHIVVHQPELRECIGEHEFFFENADGRIVLAFPLYDRVLIGTSDLPIADPDQAECTDDEVDYFLELVRRVFPRIQVSRKDVVFRFSGVRPLERQAAGSTGQLSRASKVHILEPSRTGLRFRVYSLVGGKWTGFRALSERAADLVLRQLGVNRKVSTQALPIGGGRDFDTRVAEQIPGRPASDGLPDQGRILYDRYGSRAEAIGHYISGAPDQPLSSAPQFTRREIRFLAANEKVVHLDDVLLRRTVLAMLGRVTSQNLQECAEAVGEVLEWSREQQAAEAARARDILTRRHGVRLEGEW